MTDTLSGIGNALGQAIGGAIDWVAETRATAKSVDREADQTIEALRRYRNKSRRLAKAASRPPAIGIFGISQAGKSFLVDSLSKGENGRLESMLGNTRLDFMKHVHRRISPSRSTWSAKPTSSRSSGTATSGTSTRRR
jgi:hypothetical protein